MSQRGPMMVDCFSSRSARKRLAAQRQEHLNSRITTQLCSDFSLTPTHLDISVNEILGMNVFNARDQLIGEHQHSLECESTIAIVEQIFERRTQQIHHKYVVVTLFAEPTHAGNTGNSASLKESSAK